MHVKIVIYRLNSLTYIVLKGTLTDWVKMSIYNQINKHIKWVTRFRCINPNQSIQ